MRSRVIQQFLPNAAHRAVCELSVAAYMPSLVTGLAPHEILYSRAGNAPHDARDATDVTRVITREYTEQSTLPRPGPASQHTRYLYSIAVCATVMYHYCPRTHSVRRVSIRRDALRPRHSRVNPQRWDQSRQKRPFPGRAEQRESKCFPTLTIAELVQLAPRGPLHVRDRDRPHGPACARLRMTVFPGRAKAPAGARTHDATMYHKAISSAHAHTQSTHSVEFGVLTTSEPPKPNGALAVFPGEQLVVDEPREQRGGGVLGREELREELHVVELALDGVREHDLRARYERGAGGVGRMGGGRGERVGEHFGEGCLLDANYNMRGLESRVQLRSSLRQEVSRICLQRQARNVP